MQVDVSRHSTSFAKVHQQISSKNLRSKLEAQDAESSDVHHLMHTHYQHEEIYRQLTSEVASAVAAAAPASLAESLSKPVMMQFSLTVEFSPTSCVHSAFEAEQTLLGRQFRAAPISWAHIIVTGPIYHCS